MIYVNLHWHQPGFVIGVPPEIMRKLILPLLLGLLALVPASPAAVVALNSSIITLATEGMGPSGDFSQVFAFTDGAETINVTLTMNPLPSGEYFTMLDGDTRSGIGVDGDGNWVDSAESVTFNAHLDSVTSGVNLSSVTFRIVGLGLRFNGGTNLFWTSSASPVSSRPVSSESLLSMDTNSANISTVDYTATLSSDGLFQLSSNVTGSGLQMEVTYTAVPEPGATGLLLAAVGLAGIRRRRRI
jgi:hypothetical protein